MKKLDEILYKKSIELETKENKLKKEAEEKELKRIEVEEKELKRIEAEEIRQREIKEELRRKEAEKIKQNEIKRIAKKKAILNSAAKNAFSYGKIGLIIGAVIGFVKGCDSYSNSAITSSGYKPFLELLRYIIPNALIICLVGVIIGILIGINKGQNT